MKVSTGSADGGLNGVMYYHADASPLGGHFTHPKERALPTRGSVSLGQAGGHAKARVKKFNPHPSISTGTAYSEAKGGVDAVTGNWTTIVTSVVEDVNLFDMVTADRIVANLAIEHPRKGDYPCVSFEGCAFENLKIAGKPVTLDLNLAMLTAKDHDFPAVPWPEVAGFVKRAVAQNAKIVRGPGVPKALKDRFSWMGQKDKRTRKGYIVCSLVAGIQGTKPGSTFGHVVRVPGFGDVFLGELIVDARSFHLNMLRAEMGGDGNAVTKTFPKRSGKADLTAATAPPAGNVSLASTRGNGSLG